MNSLNLLRENNPLVICYTNDVVKNFTANGLLSIGASPAMSEAPEEAVDMLTYANALLINIGTLTKAREADILKIAKTANQIGTPVVFDPVAVGASQYRKDFCATFLKEIDVTVIKGNASEILALMDTDTKMKGTDSDQDLDAITIAKNAYNLFNTAIAITGEVDVVVQDNQIYKLSNGSPLLAKVTGAGCLLGAVIASFLNKDNKVTIEMLIEAISIYNIASEQAEQNSKNNGPGSFMVELLNALYHIKYDHYLKMSNRQEV
ncbi:hydroxyethylthiazole kinase [Staphylococcus shinii]|jgi:hydroxyethylthiazole kinase|uniref:Hydroxyethylthiazole kinase n=1 Tax=Staphylococcus shinii TaxID=2912228 RepID=A0A418IET2_9STAP|nr:hydroxyethylthiazole kinase [Staphylococcus shinii]MBO3066321.1 hydroxyethylthiazole kinase [Staphylococcus shinii]MDW8565499.1 hydroxyethylthiazole kinase [Staphylococcus shinii]MDW8568752.1 hydroxyethylthiazole kinase [Staphylococcus shinii]MDW8568922.1 hydroxyethylthiazole kinase [Staphylococcus shinii]MDW8572497.1 hydroxyethylthiazole kinase [Staphylococcus shinii]